MRSKTFAVGLACSLALIPIPLAAPAHASPDEARSPIASELRSALPRPLREAYAARGYQPIWFQGAVPSPRAQELIELLSSARLDGLDPAAYQVDRLSQAIEAARGGDADAVARAEGLLSRALVAYARDLHGPTEAGMSLVDEELAPKAPSPGVVIAAAAAGEPPDEAAQMHPLYREMRAAYAGWLARWGRLPEVAIPAGPTLTSRSHGERVRLLRERLGLPEGTSFDAEAAAAVRDFRAAHGLPPGSTVDAATLKLLNTPLRDEEARIRVNLARARQLPAPWRGRHIVVDAASQRLWMYDGSKVVDSMKVVVGKPSEPTPMLAALIRYAALNPYWYIPPDLVQKSVAPDVLHDGLGYLKEKGYEVLSDWSDDPQPVDPSTVDWKAVAAGKQELPMRQLPGPANMMGAIKFMFPNKFGVYLHDTPLRGLFEGNDRRKSSGCVRLEDAPRVAKWLFGAVPAADGAEARVPLPKPVPVYITYLTAVPTGSGFAFRDDVYGRDRAAGTRLAAAK